MMLHSMISTCLTVSGLKVFTVSQAITVHLQQPLSNLKWGHSKQDGALTATFTTEGHREKLAGNNNSVSSKLPAM